MAVIGTFHLILSNPPYIPESALDSLPRGVKDYEPREALNGGPWGIDLHRELIAAGGDLLISGGWLIMEIDEFLRDRVYELAISHGQYKPVTVREDYAGQARVIALRKR